MEGLSQPFLGSSMATHAISKKKILFESLNNKSMDLHKICITDRHVY